MELETLLWMSINLLIWRDQELHFKDQKILKTLKIYQTLYKDQFLRWVDQSLAFQDLEQIDLYQNLGKIAYKMLYRETGLEQLDL